MQIACRYGAGRSASPTGCRPPPPPPPPAWGPWAAAAVAAAASLSQPSRVQGGGPAAAAARVEVAQLADACDGLMALTYAMAIHHATPT
jgi:hypothetical protein